MNRIDVSTAEWRRVSPKYIVVDMIGTAIVGAIAIGASTVWLLLTDFPLAWAAVIGASALTLLNLALTPRRVRAIGYQLRDDDLLFRRGLLFRRIVAVPYGRMQLIDINRGPVDRAIGLSELKFVTAAASTGVVIPGLPHEEAEELRDRLVALAETRRAGL